MNLSYKIDPPINLSCRAIIDFPVTKCFVERIARVVELVDTQDLGSCAARCGGSSPPSRTT